MKVAIDGPAGSGKSTIAKILAHRYDFTLIDTGAMYRSVTLIALREGADVTDEAKMAEIARRIRISFYPAEDGEGQMVFIDGENVTAAIRTADVDATVSTVSAYPEVRQALVEAQRQMGEEGDVVAEGRDIGTVVFPDAEVKVFLTADPQARAHRRALQRDVSDPDQEMKILEDLVRRDDADSSRELSPLRAADDAYVMDSTSMSIEEEIAQISELIEAARPGIVPVIDEDPNHFEEPAPVETETVEVDQTVQDEAPLVETPQEEAPEEAPAKKKKSKKGKDKGKGKDKSKDTEVAPAPADQKPAQETPQAPKAKKAPKEKREATEEKMRSFKRYPDDEYYDHGIDDYPVGGKLILMTAVGVCGGLSKVLWPWSVENGKNLWKADGGRVVIMNHESMMDPVIVVCSDYFHGRKMRPIYKSELDKVPILKWLLARVGAIPVSRGKADIKCVRRAQRALQRGEDVLVFPEGHRILSDDQEIEIHAGFALMAQLAKAPVLPMAIVGARDGGIGGNGPIRPGRVYMAVGDPITFDEIEAKGRKQQASEMEEKAMKAVYSLRDRLRAKHPGKM